MFHLSPLIVVLLTSLASMVAVFWLYFKILRLALDKDLVDNPNARKLQKRPIPVLGGVVVFFGIITAVLLARCFIGSQYLSPILMAMSVMLYIGLLDDLMGLTPKCRFVVEILVMLALIFGSGTCIDSLHGLWGVGHFSWWIGVPLTVVAGVGIINAMNMIDGVNGLSSGLCIVCSLCFGFALYHGHDYPNAVLAFAMAAGLFPFLVHNVIGKTSKMFIGDAGTMVMGVLMAWFVMQILKLDGNAYWVTFVEGDNMSLVALVLAILSVPVFDTLRVMTMRMVHGRSPFSADKTHLHHMLYDYGHSHSITSVTEITLDMLVVIAWLISFWCGASIDLQFYVVLLMSVLLVWGTYIFLTTNLRLNTGLSVRLRRVMVNSRKGNTDWWRALQTRVDTPTLGNLGLEQRDDDPNATITAPERRHQAN